MSDTSIKSINTMVNAGKLLCIDIQDLFFDLKNEIINYEQLSDFSVEDDFPVFSSIHAITAYNT